MLPFVAEGFSMTTSTPSANMRHSLTQAQLHLQLQVRVRAQELLNRPKDIDWRSLKVFDLTELFGCFWLIFQTLQHSSKAIQSS